MPGSIFVWIHQATQVTLVITKITKEKNLLKEQ